MPWFLSFGRITYGAIYTFAAYTQVKWIYEAEERYKRSLTWRPAVGIITDHHQIFNKLGASHVWYRFKPEGSDAEYSGDTFRSGGIFKEEPLKHANLLGVGTELVVYYSPSDPGNENCLKIAVDRHVEAYIAFSAILCAMFAVRFVRCETVLPNMFYRFLNVNHRLSENTGMKIPGKKKGQQAKKPGPKGSQRRI